MGWTHGRPASERGHMELAAFADEAIEIRQLVVGAVGDGFEAEEVEAAFAGDPCDGGGFHVDEGRLIFLGKLALFVLAGNMVERDEALAFSRGGGKAFAGDVVDDFANGDRFRRPQSAGERTRPADRDECVDVARGENMIDSTGNRGAAHAGAGGGDLDGSDVATEGVVMAAPVVDERFEFAGKGCDDADAFHRVCGQDLR